MDPEVQKELWAQSAHTLALESLLFSLLSELERSGVLNSVGFARLFDQAEDTLTAGAMKVGRQAPPEFSTRALKIVTEIRAQFVPLRRLSARR